MAQQSARRDRDNQAATPYFEYATLIWTRSANSHAGRRSMAAQRPDRWQHPTTRHGIPDVFPCPEGGVHRCCTELHGSGRLAAGAGRCRKAAPFPDTRTSAVPFKAKAAYRRHIPKQQHRVINWAAYDAGLRARGSLTVWFTTEAIKAWRAEPRTGRGGQPRYSSLAIMTALTLRGDCREIGVMPQWQLADADRWRLGSAARSRCRACRCRGRSGPGAAGRPRAGTSASAATWPCAG